MSCENKWITCKKKPTGEHKLISYLKNTCKNKQILCKKKPILKII